MTKVDLSVNFMGLDFKNPYILAPAPPTWDAKRMIQGFEAGWSGAIMKTTSFEKLRYTRPRHSLFKTGKKTIGLASTELISEHPIEWWEKQIPKALAVANKNDAKFGASIMAGDNLDDWTKLARRVEDLDVHFVELNFSCPIGSNECGMGCVVGQQPGLIEPITRAVKKEVSIPVMCKMTPNNSNIVASAAAAKRGGADAVSAIGMLLCIPRVDVETGIPIPNIKGVTTPSCMGGTMIRPYALRAVADIRNGVDIQICGMGGVDDWRSSVEFFMCGAGLLQVATAVMLYGFDILGPWMKDLSSYMERKGYSRISDFMGVAAKRVVLYSNLEVESPISAYIDPKKCNGCGLCKGCLFDAIKITKGKTARVDPKKCNGCGQCLEICPQEAPSFVKVK